MNYLNNLIVQIKKLDVNKVYDLASYIKKIYRNKNNIFICGNGGSAANANHISNDLMHGFTKNKIGFPFISLSSNIAKISCIGNDLGYEKIFSNQLRVLGKKND